MLVDQWFEIKLVDPETGDEVAPGQAGELLVRHKQPGIISTEYLGMPDKTIESRRDLWFHTGDALKRDEQGWYYFVDRVRTRCVDVVKTFRHLKWKQSCGATLTCQTAL